MFSESGIDEALYRISIFDITSPADLPQILGRFGSHEDCQGYNVAVGDRDTYSNSLAEQ